MEEVGSTVVAGLSIETIKVPHCTPQQNTWEKGVLRFVEHQISFHEMYSIVVQHVSNVVSM